MHLLGNYGTDAVRWWLLREVPRGADADFTIGRLVSRANDELANGLGNLVNRVVTMIHRYRDGRVPATTASAPDAVALDEAIRNAPGLIAGALGDFDFRGASGAVWPGLGPSLTRRYRRGDDGCVEPIRRVRGHRGVDQPAAERPAVKGLPSKG